MKTKFTSGPWKSKVYDETFFEINSGEDQIAEVYAEANAHLIAAAPEMYEALERMVAVFKVLSPGDGWWQEEYDMALSALKKARGES